jgi:pimeloyl-ACP methyl ester carboxylesterase
MRRIVAALALLALTQLSGCSWLDVKQRELALRPTPGRPPGYAEGSAILQAAFRPGDQRWIVNVRGAAGGPEQLALWWLPQPDASAPTLLYLHGTFRNLYQNLPKINALREAGFAIVAVDYRGWGDSTPIIPSEDSITADARVAWAEVVKRQPTPGRRVIYGHSMGGATAVSLASGLKGGGQYGALVLESTFTRLPDVAESAGFWGKVGAAVTTLEFDSLSRIGNIDAPILMLHGTADNTIPIDLGQRLREAAPRGTRWVPVVGGSHSQLQSEAPELYQATFKALIKRLVPAPELPPESTPALSSASSSAPSSAPSAAPSTAKPAPKPP